MYTQQLYCHLVYFLCMNYNIMVHIINYVCTYIINRETEVRP